MQSIAIIFLENLRIKTFPWIYLLIYMLHVLIFKHQLAKIAIFK